MTPTERITHAYAARARGAFLGAAIGDALGWPQELPGHRVASPSVGLQSWTKRDGGRFYAHDENIEAGSYSDDTQLILATARSLSKRPQWHQWLARVELPEWTLYERGAGRATKRSALSWATNTPPWLNSKSVRDYFDAGGNGVAMRILPHCINHSNAANFLVLAQEIVANGVTTHGHPRAIIGALAYGYALWQAIRIEKTFAYGELIERVLESRDWTRLPTIDEYWPDWRDRTFRITAEYAQVWGETVEELRTLLSKALQAMKKGALALDQETIKELGCFDKRSNGSGTVTAAASIFIASRYLTDPVHGLHEAAYAKGADTDTLASMVAALMGARLGEDWIPKELRQVQDATLIAHLAEESLQGAIQGSLGIVPAVTVRQLELCKKEIESSSQGNKVQLPSGRIGRVTSLREHSAPSGTLRVTSIQLTTEDGQTLHAKKLSRQRSAPPLKSSKSTPGKVGIKVYVRDLATSRHFYEEILGLPVTKESSGFVSLAGSIALLPGRGATASRAVAISIETTNLSPILHTLERIGIEVETQSNRTHRSILTTDPDGNRIEIYEVRN